MNTATGFAGITAVQINNFINIKGQIIPTDGVSASTSVGGPSGEPPHTGYIMIIYNY